eukprot:g6328.t1
MPACASLDGIIAASGKEEGVFGWISANYLMGNLKPDEVPSSHSTVGSLDLGGASTQIVFMPQKSTIQHAFPLHLGPHRVQVYSYSFLHFGQREAAHRTASTVISDALLAVQSERTGGPRRDGETTVSHPCFAKGYIYTPMFSYSGETFAPIQVKMNGTSDFQGCEDLVKLGETLEMLFARVTDEYRAQDVTPSGGGVFMPSRGCSRGPLGMKELHLTEPDDVYPGTDQQVITLESTGWEHIVMAMRQVLAMVNNCTECVMPGHEDERRLAVVMPSRSISALIGVKGANVKELQLRTGCHIHVDDVAIGGPDGRIDALRMATDVPGAAPRNLPPFFPLRDFLEQNGVSSSSMPKVRVIDVGAMFLDEAEDGPRGFRRELVVGW